VSCAGHPSYVGDSNQEDHGSRPAWAKKFAGSHLNRKKLGVMEHVCHPSYTGRYKIGWSQFKQDPNSKIIRAKRAGGVVQALERLPNQCKALSSNWRKEGRREERKIPFPPNLCLFSHQHNKCSCPNSAWPVDPRTPIRHHPTPSAWLSLVINTKLVTAGIWTRRQRNVVLPDGVSEEGCPTSAVLGFDNKSVWQALGVIWPQNHLC
jgi:hypothetical protein